MAGRFNLEPGLTFVGAYQVSGRPWASASIDCNADVRPLTDCEIRFPYVTRWFKVINKDTSNDCRVGFSASGVTGSSNYFTVPKADVDANGAVGDSGVLELKVSAIWVSGSTNVDIVAGLTNIPPGRTSTGTPPGSGPNWSGSSGVG